MEEIALFIAPVQEAFKEIAGDDSVISFRSALHLLAEFGILDNVGHRGASDFVNGEHLESADGFSPAEFGVLFASALRLRRTSRAPVLQLPSDAPIARVKELFTASTKGAALMTAETFTKLLVRSGLPSDDICASYLEVVFAQACEHGAMGLSVVGFLNALRLLADAMGVPPREVCFTLLQFSVSPGSKPAVEPKPNLATAGAALGAAAALLAQTMGKKCSKPAPPAPPAGDLARASPRGTPLQKSGVACWRVPDADDEHNVARQTSIPNTASTAKVATHSTKAPHPEPEPARGKPWSVGRGRSATAPGIIKAAHDSDPVEVSISVAELSKSAKAGKKRAASVGSTGENTERGRLPPPPAERKRTSSVDSARGHVAREPVGDAGAAVVAGATVGLRERRRSSSVGAKERAKPAAGGGSRGPAMKAAMPIGDRQAWNGSTWFEPPHGVKGKARGGEAGRKRAGSGGGVAGGKAARGSGGAEGAMGPGKRRMQAEKEWNASTQPSPPAAEDEPPGSSFSFVKPNLLMHQELISQLLEVFTAWTVFGTPAAQREKRRVGNASVLPHAAFYHLCMESTLADAESPEAVLAACGKGHTGERLSFTQFLEALRALSIAKAVDFEHVVHLILQAPQPPAPEPAPSEGQPQERGARKAASLEDIRGEPAPAELRHSAEQLKRKCMARMGKAALSQPENDRASPRGEEILPIPAEMLKIPEEMTRSPSDDLEEPPSPSVRDQEDDPAVKVAEEHPNSVWGMWAALEDTAETMQPLQEDFDGACAPLELGGGTDPPEGSSAAPERGAGALTSSEKRAAKLKKKVQWVEHVRYSDDASSPGIIAASNAEPGDVDGRKSDVNDPSMAQPPEPPASSSAPSSSSREGLPAQAELEFALADAGLLNISSHKQSATALRDTFREMREKLSKGSTDEVTLVRLAETYRHVLARLHNAEGLTPAPAPAHVAQLWIMPDSPLRRAFRDLCSESAGAPMNDLSAGVRMGRALFAKVCQQCRLVNNELTTETARIIFARAKGRGAHTLGYPRFVRALSWVAADAEQTFQHVAEQILSGGAIPLPTPQSSPSAHFGETEGQLLPQFEAEHMRGAFNRYAPAGTLGLSRMEVACVLHDVGALDSLRSQPAAQSLHCAFTLADLDGDGLISASEFVGVGVCMLSMAEQAATKHRRQAGSSPWFKPTVSRDSQKGRPRGDTRALQKPSDEEITSTSLIGDEMCWSQFVSLCTGSKLLSSTLGAEGMDIIFARASTAGKTTLRFPDFLYALLLIGEDSEVGFKEVEAKIKLWAETQPGGSSRQANQASGGSQK
eukprot:gene4483-5495_t